MTEYEYEYDEDAEDEDYDLTNDERLAMVEDYIIDTHQEQVQAEEAEDEIADLAELQAELGRDLTSGEIEAVADLADETGNHPADFADDLRQLHDTSTPEGRVDLMSLYAQDALQGDDDE